jgi:hypothetical protein
MEKGGYRREDIRNMSKWFSGFPKPEKNSLNSKKLEKPETWISRYISQ